MVKFLRMIYFLFNLPFNLVGIIPLLLSNPYKFKWNKEPFALVFKVKSFWWAFGYIKKARAMTVGHIVLLGPEELKNDLEHELIHVKQVQKYLLMYPVLYYWEFFRKGYRKNRFEDEAFTSSGSIHKP